MRTMRWEAGSAVGTAQGALKRISQLFVRVFETVGFSVGYDEDTAEPQEFRTADMDMDTAVPLFSGDKQVPFPPSDDERDGYVYIEQDEPLPCTIVALMPKLEVHDL
jgi:hypothetical protein